MTTRLPSLATALAIALLAVPAAADEDEGGVGLDVAVEIASAFVFRGLNQFGDAQGDQRASVFPAITVSAGAFSGGYWGAYQLSGANTLRKVDNGFGAENDLWVGYEREAGDLGYSASLTYYAFPFADQASAGTSIPMYLEPAAGVSYATAVELALNLSYFGGLQAATQSSSYFYVNPSVSKKLPVKRTMELSLTGAYGIKLWTGAPQGQDNSYDLQLDAALEIPFGTAYVTPAVHLAWTNLGGIGYGDEIVVWAGVLLGGTASDL